MKPAPFRYHAPATVDEAVALLAQLADEDGRVLAGGQSLVPTMAFRLARPAHLVDINGVAGLDRVAVDGDRLCVGACVRHVRFETPVIDGPLGRLMTNVVRHIAHYPDPHPRHLLRQPRPFGPGLRMVPRWPRPSMPRWWRTARAAPG